MQDAELIAMALQYRERAYAPYSNYSVGAAVRSTGGQVYGGCNVENASYGLCNCAERTAIFTAIAEGARAFDVVVVATKDGGSPCGACRQVLAEFVPPTGGEGMRVLLVDSAGRVVTETTLGALLPLSFALSGDR